jgi:hypothetical protein
MDAVDMPINAVRRPKAIVASHEDIANSTIRQAMDQGRQAAENRQPCVKNGYQAAQEYFQERHPISTFRLSSPRTLDRDRRWIRPRLRRVAARKASVLT